MTRAVRSIALTAAVGLLVYLGTVVWFYFALESQIDKTNKIASDAKTKADDDRRYQVANCILTRKLGSIALTDARGRISFEVAPGVDKITGEQGRQWETTKAELQALEGPVCPAPPPGPPVPTSKLKPLATPSPVSNVRIERASRPLVARTGD